MHITDKAREVLDKLVEMFLTDELPEAIAETVIHAGQLDIPSARWSAVNRMIMLLNNARDARTYNQWREVGRFPKKRSNPSQGPSRTKGL